MKVNVFKVPQAEPNNLSELLALVQQQAKKVFTHDGSIWFAKIATGSIGNIGKKQISH